MLIKALKLQQDMEDAENEAIMSKLQSEVDRLQDSFDKKDGDIASLKRALTEAKKENEEARKTHEQDELKIKEQDEAIN